MRVWVYGEGSTSGKREVLVRAREDEDDVEKTRKIYYGSPLLGEDATAVCARALVGSRGTCPYKSL